MRPVVFVCAIVAGTAARFIFAKLGPFRRHRRQRDPSTEETAVSASLRASPKQTRHPQVLALLNAIAPVIRGASYTARHGCDRDCTFCLESITSTSPFVRVTPCHHVFHADCLEQWVLYSASASLDWRNYVVCDDGSVGVTASPPSCPNCTARLPVLPPNLVRVAMLTSIAHSLSLPNLSAAAHMYDAGFVFRAPPTSVVRPQPIPLTTTTTAPAVRSTFFFPSDPIALHATAHASLSSTDNDIPSSLPLALVAPPSLRMFERNVLRHVGATNPTNYPQVLPHVAIEAST